MEDHKIRISYTWGDEESPIPCDSDKAFDKMLELAITELNTCLYEHPESHFSLNVDPINMVISLFYGYDGETCFYKYE